jgi:hypothetical protein
MACNVDISATTVRSLSRLRGRVGVGVLRQAPARVERIPPPAALARGDLPRKREWWTPNSKRQAPSGGGGPDEAFMPGRRGGARTIPVTGRTYSTT